MKNSIETIWKEGFLNEKSMIAPKINDLYNQKSKHMVERVNKMFRVNLFIIVSLSVLFPIIHYFLDALWQGVAASILLLLVAGYNQLQLLGIKTLDQGATSLEYLKSLDRWLKDVLLRSEKIVRFYYPLCFLIAISTVWSAWNNQEELVMKTRQKLPDFIFIGNIPLFALIIVGVITLLMYFFSAKIYRWDVRLMYGRVFGKLEETIAEMEKLKQGE